MTNASPPWRALLALIAASMLVPAPQREPRYAAIRVAPRSAGERALALAQAVDVWSEDTGDAFTAVYDTATGLTAPHEIVVDDIAAAADRERARLAHRANVDWFADYRDLDEANAFMDALHDRDPSLVTVRTLGTSLEGRPIRAIEISRGGPIGIALDGGQHAREWISVMVPLCIAHRLARGANGDPRIRRLLESVSFTIVPTVNPDGYVYTWTTDRYWRKNRRDGRGVDLNRNYGIGWGGAGSSSDPRSPNYRGTHPFSEPETQAMQSLFESHAIRAHVDFHSYSQVIVYPWSYQREEPPDHEQFAALADAMATAFHATHGERYAIRPGSELTTGVGGTLADWAYGETGALAFLVELRPAKGPDGFVLPPEQIVPVCDESLAATLALAEAIARAPTSTHPPDRSQR